MSVESSITEGELLQSLDGPFPAGSLSALRNNHNARHNHIIIIYSRNAVYYEFVRVYLREIWKCLVM